MKKKHSASKKNGRTQKLARLQELNHLVSVGDATLRDFSLLGIESVDELSRCDARELYERLCRAKGVKVDPCCQDVFQAAIAQARDPKLAPAKKNWWYWSRQRKKTLNEEKRKS